MAWGVKKSVKHMGGVKQRLRFHLHLQQVLYFDPLRAVTTVQHKTHWKAELFGLHNSHGYRDNIAIISYTVNLKRNKTE